MQVNFEYDHVECTVDNKNISIDTRIHIVYKCILSIIYLYIYIWQCVKTNSTPFVHIKIAGKWMFIPLKMVLIGIDP